MTSNVKENGAVDGSGVCSAMDDSRKTSEHVSKSH